jgi:hypothetical protein
VAWLDGAGEQAADLAGGQPDELVAVVIMLSARPGKLSAGAGAPFELGDFDGPQVGEQQVGGVPGAVWSLASQATWSRS